MYVYVLENMKESSRISGFMNAEKEEEEEMRTRLGAVCFSIKPLHCETVL